MKFENDNRPFAVVRQFDHRPLDRPLDFGIARPGKGQGDANQPAGRFGGSRVGFHSVGCGCRQNCWRRRFRFWTASAGGVLRSLGIGGGIFDDRGDNADFRGGFRQIGRGVNGRWSSGQGERGAAKDRPQANDRQGQRWRYNERGGRPGESRSPG